MPEASYPPLSPVQTGLAGRCPRCGQGHLYSGLLAMRPDCEVCGLTYPEPGDGGAVFVILLGNIVILALALWVEFTWSPPLWVHALLWVPICLVFSVGVARLIKGVLVCLAYVNQAAEGQLET